VLSPGNRERASVVGRFGHGATGFSRDMLEPELGQVAMVHPDAGRGWQCVDITTPCSPACCTRLGGMQMFGNAQHALRVLGGTGVSGWHGRCAACGGSEAAVSRGIDRARVEELGGEVTGPGAVGAVQPKMGVHDGQGDGDGVVGCSSGATARWGRGLGARKGGVLLLGVEGGARVRSE
jgi:hypothetical protein